MPPDFLEFEIGANPDVWRNSGFEEKTQLEKEPAYFYLRRILRMKFVPIDHPFSPPVIVPNKPTMIEGCSWGSGLLAEILANKYLYHLPFDRQTSREHRHVSDWLGPHYQGI